MHEIKTAVIGRKRKGDPSPSPATIPGIPRDYVTRVYLPQPYISEKGALEFRDVCSTATKYSAISGLS
jgi:hypothetical protein